MLVSELMLGADSLDDFCTVLVFFHTLHRHSDSSMQALDERRQGCFRQTNRRISPSRMWNCVIFMKRSKQHKDSKSTVKLKINCSSFRGMLVRVTSGSRAIARLVGWSLLAAWCTVDVWIAAAVSFQMFNHLRHLFALILVEEMSHYPLLLQNANVNHFCEDLHSQNQDYYTVEDSEQNQILRAFENLKALRIIN